MAEGDSYVGNRSQSLMAGDKSKGKRGRTEWSGWYRQAIPEAEKT